MDKDRAPHTIRFGPFVANLETRELRKDGIRVPLQQQPFEVLATLLDRPGQMVSREELHKRLWPEGTFVDHDRGLNKAVNRLREILGDDADHPVFIETLPQRGYRFIAQMEPAEVTPKRMESIAVLPLENLSGDPAEDYFCDGITDELIGELAQIASLHVISRTSCMRYKGAGKKTLPEIANELGVDTVVEGTVMRVGGKVRISAQLIRAHDDRHLWSQRYERDLSHVLELQADVARSVSREVRATLRPDEMRHLTQSRKIRPDAYQAYLQGNFFLHQNIRGVAKSTEWFRKAIDLDPDHADAHAGLAQSLIFAGIYEMRPFAEAYLEARGAAQKALDLDDRNASAHNALADVMKGLDWDLEVALKLQRRALELSPSHLLARLWLAETFSRLELHEEALSESARAVSLDPVSAISHNNRSMLLWRARRYDEAIREAETALELDPSHLNALWWRGLAHTGRLEFATAIGCFKRGFEISRAPLFLGSLGYAHGLAGEPEQAQSALAGLQTAAHTRYVSAVNFAIVHAGLGDTDAAFEWLHKAYEARDGRVQQLVQPCFDGLRADPRYSRLKAAIGLG